jgi:hypothetical protein
MSHLQPDNCSVYKNGIYFISDSDSFSYFAHCLADGLSQLGIAIYANICFTDLLVSNFKFIQNTKIHPTECACTVLDLQKTERFNGQVVSLEPLPERTFIISMQDNLGEFCIEGGAAQLVTYENRFHPIDGPRIPIGFGVSTAMLQKSAGLSPDRSRIEDALGTFRPSLGQDVRAALELALIPTLNRHFLPVTHANTGQDRWCDSYFSLLASHRASLTYGGYFAQDLAKNDFFGRSGLLPPWQGRRQFLHDTVILRWDSWRFWESLVFGCLAIHLDFDEYGFTLPVMPVNWQHYVGIRFSSIQQDIERMMDERKRLPEIAWNGRCWAIKHYSPAAVAKRFLARLQHNIVSNNATVPQ